VSLIRCSWLFTRASCLIRTLVIFISDLLAKIEHGKIAYRNRSRADHGVYTFSDCRFRENY